MDAPEQPCLGTSCLLGKIRAAEFSRPGRSILIFHSHCNQELTAHPPTIYQRQVDA